MRKILTFILTIILPALVMSQAVIVFETKDHDFGKIKEEDGKTTFEFVFTNQGNEPLVISRVQPSCGCTTPSWTKSPIEPGKKGIITATYSPDGHSGKFAKSITVHSNATSQQEKLIIRGDVASALKNDSKNKNASFPIEVENVRLESGTVNFNNTEKGTISKSQLKIKNTSNEAVKLAFSNIPAYISIAKSNIVLEPDAEDVMLFTFDSKKCSKWGVISDEIYLILNDKKDISDTYKITLISNIVEDFSNMTIEQKRNAPILEIPNRSVNLAVLDSPVKAEGSFQIKNIGEKALEIRRVTNNNAEISFKNEQLTVRGGKTADLKFNVSGDLKHGKYKRAVTLQTNDPNNVYVVLSIEWEVK